MQIFFKKKLAKPQTNLKVCFSSSGSAEVPGSTVFDFGRHCGKIFAYDASGDSGYAQWALRQSDPGRSSKDS